MIRAEGEGAPQAAPDPQEDDADEDRVFSNSSFMLDEDHRESLERSAMDQIPGGKELPALFDQFSSYGQSMQARENERSAERAKSATQIGQRAAAMRARMTARPTASTSPLTPPS